MSATLAQAARNLPAEMKKRAQDLGLLPQDTPEGAVQAVEERVETLRSGRLQEPVETPGPEAKVVRYYQEPKKANGAPLKREGGRITAMKGFIKLVPPRELAEKGVPTQHVRSIAEDGYANWKRSWVPSK